MNLDNPSEAYLNSLYRKFGTRNPREGWDTLVCSVCGSTRGSHKSVEVSCRCPGDIDRFLFKDNEYDDDDPFNPKKNTGCFSSLEYEDQVVERSGRLVLIPVKKLKE